MGGRGYGGGRKGRVYTHRYTVTTRMTCIKMGSDESHFNVSLIVRDKVTRPCPQTTTFKEKGEQKRYRTEVLPLTSLSARPNRLSTMHKYTNTAIIPPRWFGQGERWGWQTILSMYTNVAILFLCGKQHAVTPLAVESVWMNIWEWNYRLMLFILLIECIQVCYIWTVITDIYAGPLLPLVFITNV